MIIDNKRALAYTQIVNTIVPIEGADNIELIHINAWTLIAKKGEFKEGDLAVFFEIDSKLPEEERYEFLRSKGFKVKTYKLKKFGVVSQGLALPLEMFPELPKNIKPLTDVTETLKVTYSVKEDNERKRDPRAQRFGQFKKNHSKFFSSKLGKWLLKTKWTRNILLDLFGGKKEKKYGYPSFITKTDEERVQNCPEVLQIKTPFVVTEKIDGTSTTVAVERVGRKFNIYVCSRNMCFKNASQKCYSDNDNIYWEMTNKYKLDEFLINYLKEHKDVKWACIQGESFGEKWQGNPLKIKGHDFRAFNFKTSNLDDNKHFNGRWSSLEARDLLAQYGIPWVPVIAEDFILPDSVDELLAMATGPSSLNPNVLREGWVIRDQEGTLSFKAVSIEYLLNKGE